MPTICHGPAILSISIFTVWPTASPLGKNLRAMVSFTTATFMLLAASAGLMGRPATIEIPAVSKYWPETRFSTEPISSFGAGVYPEREMEDSHVLKLMGGDPARAAERTPGIADTRSRTRWFKAGICSGL